MIIVSDMFYTTGIFKFCVGIPLRMLYNKISIGNIPSAVQIKNCGMVVTFTSLDMQDWMIGELFLRSKQNISCAVEIL